MDCKPFQTCCCNCEQKEKGLERRCIFQLALSLFGLFPSSLPLLRTIFSTDKSSTFIQHESFPTKQLQRRQLFKKLCTFQIHMHHKIEIKNQTTPFTTNSYFMCHCNFFYEKKSFFKLLVCEIEAWIWQKFLTSFLLFPDQSSIRDDSLLFSSSSSLPFFDERFRSFRNFCCYWLTSSLWPSTKFFSAWIKEPKKKKV